MLQFAAGSFHTHTNFVPDSIRLNLTFIQKTKKIAFQPPFSLGDLGVMYTHSIARWKARGRLPIFVIIELFRYLLPYRHYKRNLSKLAFFEGVITLRAIFRRKGASPTNRC